MAFCVCRLLNTKPCTVSETKYRELKELDPVLCTVVVWLHRVWSLLLFFFLAFAAVWHSTSLKTCITDCGRRMQLLVLCYLKRIISSVTSTAARTFPLNILGMLRSSVGIFQTRPHAESEVTMRALKGTLGRYGKRSPTTMTYFFHCPPAVDRRVGKVMTKPVKLHLPEEV